MPRANFVDAFGDRAVMIASSIVTHGDNKCSLGAITIHWYMPRFKKLIGLPVGDFMILLSAYGSRIRNLY